MMVHPHLTRGNNITQGTHNHYTCAHRVAVAVFSTPV